MRNKEDFTFWLTYFIIGWIFIGMGLLSEERICYLFGISFFGLSLPYSLVRKSEEQ